MPKAPALEVHDEVCEDWKTTKKDHVKWAREVKDLHWSSDMASSHVAKREEAVHELGDWARIGFIIFTLLSATLPER